ncbi:MAG: hypothetical protein NXI31_03325 [bacterium]|nr:hypothetical protein [bacterium]
MTERRFLRSLGLALVVTVTLPSCGADSPAIDPDWAANLARLDPMFGGGTVYDTAWNDGQLIDHTRYTPRRQLFRRQRTAFDTAAAKRVARLVPPDVATAAIKFLGTPAGLAMAQAETLAATTEAWPFDDLPARLGERLRNPAGVGEAAAAAIWQARQEVAAGGSPSPPLVALLLAAKRVTPDEANAIDAFCRSAAGERWMAARIAAWPETIAGFRAAPTTPESGWSSAPTGDLILPQDEGGK